MEWGRVALALDLVEEGTGNGEKTGGEIALRGLSARRWPPPFGHDVRNDSIHLMS